MRNKCELDTMNITSAPGGDVQVVIKSDYIINKGALAEHEKAMRTSTLLMGVAVAGCVVAAGAVALAVVFSILRRRRVHVHRGSRSRGAGGGAAGERAAEPGAEVDVPSPVPVTDHGDVEAALERRAFRKADMMGGGGEGSRMRSARDLPRERCTANEGWLGRLMAVKRRLAASSPGGAGVCLSPLQPQAPRRFAAAVDAGGGGDDGTATPSDDTARRKRKTRQDAEPSGALQESLRKKLRVEPVHCVVQPQDMNPETLALLAPGIQDANGLQGTAAEDGVRVSNVNSDFVGEIELRMGEFLKEAREYRLSFKEQLSEVSQSVYTNRYKMMRDRRRVERDRQSTYTSRCHAQDTTEGGACVKKSYKKYRASKLCTVEDSGEVTGNGEAAAGVEIVEVDLNRRNSEDSLTTKHGEKEKPKIKELYRSKCLKIKKMETKLNCRGADYLEVILTHSPAKRSKSSYDGTIKDTVSDSVCSSSSAPKDTSPPVDESLNIQKSPCEEDNSFNNDNTVSCNTGVKDETEEIIDFPILPVKMEESANHDTSDSANIISLGQNHTASDEANRKESIDSDETLTASELVDVSSKTVSTMVSQSESAVVNDSGTRIDVDTPCLGHFTLHPSLESDSSGLSEFEQRLHDFTTEGFMYSCLDTSATISPRYSRSPVKRRTHRKPKTAIAETPSSASTSVINLSGNRWDSDSFISPSVRNDTAVTLKPVKSNKRLRKKAKQHSKTEVNTCRVLIPYEYGYYCFQEWLRIATMLSKLDSQQQELLALGWEGLRATVAMFNHIFYCDADTCDIDWYMEQCDEVEERMNDHMTRMMSKHKRCCPCYQIDVETEEDLTLLQVLFVVMIYMALVLKSRMAYNILLGGIIGSMAYVFVVFMKKLSHKKGSRGGRCCARHMDPRGGRGFNRGGRVRGGSRTLVQPRQPPQFQRRQRSPLSLLDLPLEALVSTEIPRGRNATQRRQQQQQMQQQQQQLQQRLRRVRSDPPPTQGAHTPPSTRPPSTSTPTQTTNGADQHTENRGGTSRRRRRRRRDRH